MEPERDTLSALRQLLTLTQMGKITWTEYAASDGAPSDFGYASIRVMVRIGHSPQGGLMFWAVPVGSASTPVTTEDAGPEITEAMTRLYEAAAATRQKPGAIYGALLEDLAGRTSIDWE